MPENSNSKWTPDEDALLKSLIEANMSAFMAKTQILPAALRYQGQVASSINASKTAGVDVSMQVEELKELTGTITELQKGIVKLEKALHHHADGDAYAHAKNARDTILPAMADTRKAADKLETIVADDLWPLPTYREMLFIK